MNMKRWLALALASIFMLSSVQTASIEAFAAELPAEEQDVELTNENEEEEETEEITGSSEEGSSVEENTEKKTEENTGTSEGTEPAEGTVPADLSEPADPDAADAPADPAEPDTTGEPADSAEVIPEAVTEEETSSEIEVIEVTFDANGGVFPDGETVSVISVKKGEVLPSLPMNPAMEDEAFEFTGWYYEAEAVSVVDVLTLTTEEPVTLFAGYAAIDEEAAEEEVKNLVGDPVEGGMTLDANGGDFYYSLNDKIELSSPTDDLTSVYRKCPCHPYFM